MTLPAMENMSEPQKRFTGWTWLIGGVSLFLAVSGLIWNAAGTVSQVRVNTMRLDKIESIGTASAREYEAMDRQIQKVTETRTDILEKSSLLNIAVQSETKQRLAVIETTLSGNTARLVTIESLLRLALDNQKRP